MLFIATTAVFADIQAGQGVGVSSTAPVAPSKITIKGTNPPSTSNQTVDLGEYTGSITWASGKMYSDKWVRYNGNSIDIYADFGLYGSQSDAINQTNRLTQVDGSVKVRLVDKNGVATSWDYLPCNKGSQHVYFTVTPNKEYYVEFDFRTGYYHSGSFKVR